VAVHILSAVSAQSILPFAKEVIDALRDWPYHSGELVPPTIAEPHRWILRLYSSDVDLTKRDVREKLSSVFNMWLGWDVPLSHCLPALDLGKSWAEADKSITLHVLVPSIHKVGIYNSFFSSVGNTVVWGAFAKSVAFGYGPQTSLMRKQVHRAAVSASYRKSKDAQYKGRTPSLIRSKPRPTK